MARRAAVALGAALLFVTPACAIRHAAVPVASPVPPPTRPVFWSESFDEVNPEHWREVEVRRHTQYEAVDLHGRRCLRVASLNGASILLRPMRFDAHTYEWLSWDWRVDQPVEKEVLSDKSGSDAAARVYVYFDTQGLPWQKRSLDYVWSDSLPSGTVLNSAFSSDSKIIVVDSGRSALGQWRHVERNLQDDFERSFGKPMPQVLAIGVMGDSDNTEGESLAYVDDLRLSRLPAPPDGGAQAGDRLAPDSSR